MYGYQLMPIYMHINMQNHLPIFVAGVAGKPRTRAISMAEVKQHRSKDDAWLILKGKVTTYLFICTLHIPFYRTAEVTHHLLFGQFLTHQLHLYSSVTPQ